MIVTRGNAWLATVMAHMSGCADSKHTCNVPFKIKPSTQMFAEILKRDPKLASRIKRELESRDATLQELPQATDVQREEALSSVSDESSSSQQGVRGSETP